MRLRRDMDLQQECSTCQELIASAICGAVLLEVALALSERADDDLKILGNSRDTRRNSRDASVDCHYLSGVAQVPRNLCHVWRRLLRRPSRASITQLYDSRTLLASGLENGGRSVRMLRGVVMDAAQVAQAGYRGLMRGNRVVIPGWTNVLLVLMARWSPRTLLLRTVRWLQEHWAKKLYLEGVAEVLASVAGWNDSGEVLRISSMPSGSSATAPRRSLRRA